MNFLNNYNDNLNFNFNNNYYINNYPFSYNSIYILLIIISNDIFLQGLFGNKSRWFQLHAVINSIVVYKIFPDTYKIFTSFKYNLTNHEVSYYILFLHIYHLLLFKNLNKYDYFHHILFVGLGIVPCILFTESNQCYLGYICGNGIPGIFEYTSLSLYKNNKIKLKTHKFLNSINYNFFRFPLAIFSMTCNYFSYKHNFFNDNFFIIFYLNLLLFLNGTIFNYLTLNSYFEYKNKNI